MYHFIPVEDKMLPSGRMIVQKQTIHVVFPNSFGIISAVDAAATQQLLRRLF
jgi:hypothetical protein